MYYLLIALCAYCLELLLGKKYLQWISKKNYVQPLLDIGPDHAQKHGTPTMGGISFIFTIVIMTVITFIGLELASIGNGMLPLLVIVLIAYAYIGYRDDVLKITKNDNAEGLSPKQKLVAQFLIAIVIVAYLKITGFDMSLAINILNVNINMNTGILFGVYSFIIIILFMGVSNATNVTDGLDGLLASVYVISFLSLAIIAYNQVQYQILVFTLIVIFSLFAFLKYNSNPAQMFMGDTGSLALGALLVITAALLHVELMIFFFGFVFLIETISVLVQVGYFKYTKKKFGAGRRLFKMAPFHHHLEKEGYSEKRIVLMLCVVQIVASIIGLIVYFR
ncbi:phospho-N-acetylmuramoyl-pentapeptide-transferase [Mollicutes bacterium LVI A0039]|nr:phospho-N-acetylmuramoyl-pentapeptide-transferase [Mollicutes bacterium LVI A0039]